MTPHGVKGAEHTQLSLGPLVSRELPAAVMGMRTKDGTVHGVRFDKPVYFSNNLQIIFFPTKALSTSKVTHTAVIKRAKEYLPTLPSFPAIGKLTA